MFDADRPITLCEQDRLNRSLFAKYLARCLLDHHDLDSLVVGLTGGPGSGKTSLINMMLEEIDVAASNLDEIEQPIILNFSAWSYSGQGQLIYNFFRRLSSTLKPLANFPQGARIIYLLELYVSFFTQKPVPQAYRMQRSFWEKLFFRNRESAYAWESGRDLTLVKAELNELLRQQKHKIIIIIDNISRLYPDEIKQIFQIVKSIGDYKNTIYVLSFDKNQVIQAIDLLDGSGGKALVEKVVQLPFEVPPILSEDLENIFADRLRAVLDMVPEGTWNLDYWASIYYSSLKYFFKNCRDITRYVNTLNFSYPRLRDVVNPMDFFALTAIEVFLPKLYFGIRDNKDLFTDLLDQVYRLDEDQIKKDRLRLEEILSREHDFPHDQIITLLEQLFPRLRRIYEPQLTFYHSDALARKLRRLCSPDLFDAYFRLSMQSGALPENEFKTILGLAKNAQAFDQALTRLNQDDRIIKLLTRLDSRVIASIPLEETQAIIIALFDNGDLFPQGRTGPLILSTAMRIHRIIHNVLQRYKDTETRFTVLQTAIAKAEKSIYIIVHELNEQSREHQEESDRFIPLDYRDLTTDQLLSLKKFTVSRIQNWANTERLIDHPKLLSLLYAWQAWSNDHSCRDYVQRTIKNDKGLVIFLAAGLHEAITEAAEKYEKNPAWESQLKHIADFVDPVELVNRAKAIFEDAYFEKLTEREQLALLIFLDLMKVPTTKLIPQTTV
ncbi:MAG: hypothetical protein H0W64_06660 [Gammaproteobacteria bacterium]|nr:hypothetical protein [Gammaproteobacteria bacterium]